MQGEEDDVDGGWGQDEEVADSSSATPLAPRAVAKTARSRQHTPAFGMPATAKTTPAFGMIAAPSASRKKTPAGGMQAPVSLEPSPEPPRRQTPDRATLPPPMPEEEYIEKILATDDEAAPPPPRRRMNTLIEHDPLKYDSIVDENTRPTKPPAATLDTLDTLDSPDGTLGGGDEFLDLSLDLGEGRISSPELHPAHSEPPPTRRVDELDDLPIDAMLESIPPVLSLRPRALSMRPPAGASPSIPPTFASTFPPARPAPKPPAKTYDSSPTIEIVEQPADLDDARPRAGASPPRPPAAPASSHVAPRIPSPARPAERVTTAGRPKASGRPPPATPAAGTPAIGANARRSSTPPSSGLDRPTRALRVSTGSDPTALALAKVTERFEAGDFGRALMLAEQSLASGGDVEGLRHFAELCREKLRQTYVERIGSGRTILRVAVDPEALRGRALDSRLAFLLSLLDGASSVDDVVDMSSMPALEAVRALHELLQEGVVEVIEPGRRRKAP